MSHFISLADAEALNDRFRSNKETILDTAYRNQGILPICETFGREAFDDLLAIEDCQKIRIYFGMDSNYKVKLVIAAVDSHDEDILPTGSERIVDDGARCPNSCPPQSSLNS